MTEQQTANTEQAVFPSKELVQQSEKVINAKAFLDNLPDWYRNELEAAKRHLETELKEFERLVSESTKSIIQQNVKQNVGMHVQNVSGFCVTVDRIPRITDPDEKIDDLHGSWLTAADKKYIEDYNNMIRNAVKEKEKQQQEAMVQEEKPASEQETMPGSTEEDYLTHGPREVVYELEGANDKEYEEEAEDVLVYSDELELKIQKALNRAERRIIRGLEFSKRYQKDMHLTQRIYAMLGDFFTGIAQKALKQLKEQVPAECEFL